MISYQIEGGTTQFFEVIEGLGLICGGNDNSESGRKCFWKPKLESRLNIFSFLSEFVNSFNYQDYFAIVNDVLPCNIFLLDFRLKQAQPKWEIFPNFFFKELHFVLDVEDISELDQRLVDRVKIVGVCPPCRRKMG